MKNVKRWRKMRTFKEYLTESVDIKVKSPQQSTDSEIEAFISLVIEGGQVAISGLEGRIKNSKLLGFAYENGQLVGVRAIKKPVESYKQRVFKKSGVPEMSKRYKYEVGYAYTSPNMRNKGVYKDMTKEMFKGLKYPVYATTRSTNKTVIKTLEKNGFVITGEPFKGDGNYNIILLTKL